jgi:hypothetical protein
MGCSRSEWSREDAKGAKEDAKNAKAWNLRSTRMNTKRSHV